MRLFTNFANMIKVVIIGAGNVATHLAEVFIKTTSISLIQVFNRSISAIQPLKDHTALTNDISKLKKADIYIIAVSDKAIEELSAKINPKKAIVVHTSGSTPLKVLKQHKNYGVFYPLQTFSKDNPVDFSSIPICLEANNHDNLLLLEKLAKKLSQTYHFINSEQRAHLHTAAVFVNNFVNHLYHIGNVICKENEIESDILQPLIQETARKAARFSPYSAQTGPARRGDGRTIEKHLEKLSKNQQEIYKLLSHSIAATYGKKL